MGMTPHVCHTCSARGPPSLSSHPLLLAAPAARCPAQENLDILGARVAQLRINCFFVYWAGWALKDKQAVLRLYKEAPTAAVSEGQAGGACLKDKQAMKEKQAVLRLYKEAPTAAVSASGTPRPTLVTLCSHCSHPTAAVRPPHRRREQHLLAIPLQNEQHLLAILMNPLPPKPSRLSGAKGSRRAQWNEGPHGPLWPASRL